ncbi:MAG: hypothetical protein JXB00_01150 [Bacteroidales bacterium]|nr:hypothetical protein [Bacteroidales bacterium]
MKKLKQRLKAGKVHLGTFLSLGSSVASEIISKAGFDFVIIDLEHGVGNEKDILSQLQGVDNGVAASIVRVEGHNRQRVHRVLDLGAEGIMFPRIKTIDEAQKAINSLYYTPEGERGVAKMVRATNFGLNFNEYLANQKKDIIGIIQVETEEILDCLDDVSAIEGVDILFVGPMDLSMALGIFGQFDHPRFTEALKITSQAAAKAGKTCGVLLTNAEQFTGYYELGFRFFTLGADIGFINSGAHNTVKRMVEIISENDAKKKQ